MAASRPVPISKCPEPPVREHREPRKSNRWSPDSTEPEGATDQIRDTLSTKSKGRVSDVLQQEWPPDPRQKAVGVVSSFLSVFKINSRDNLKNKKQC